MTSRLTTLDNGLRVASFGMPHAQTVSFGIWAIVGGRNEPKRLSGISHFIEHLLFKGTPRRSARRISEEVEGVGGYLNAFTAEEQTCYYACSAAEYFPKVFPVLSDMYLNARFAPADIELERGVIAEEITMYRDEPGQHVLELLSGVLWPGHALGRPLTGSLETIAQFDRTSLLRYRERHYHASNTLVTAAGRIDHEALVERVGRTFGDLPDGSPSTTPPAPKLRRPRVAIETRPTEQTHVALGLPTFRAADPRRYALAVLNIVLGGNMSSRLFQTLRERRGLCYSVDSHLNGFRDTGALAITLGLDQRNLTRSLQLIGREWRRLREQPLRRAELRRAKDYLIGTARMSLERSSSQSNRLGSSLAKFGRIVEPAESHRKVEAVTAEEIQDLAVKLLRPDRLSAAVVGPVEGSTPLLEALE